MSLNTSEDRNANVRLYVPQAYGVILAAGEQQLQLMRMEFQLIDCLAMANVIAHGFVLFNVNDTDDSAVAGGGKQRRGRL